MGCLQFDGRDVVAVLEQASGVEPVDRFGGGVFDLVDGVSGAEVSDHFGLVEAVDGLGQHVVGRADGAD